MSWADKIEKQSTKSSGGSIKVVEEENDFPIESPNYMRIGSAHAVERNGDRQLLEQLLAKFAQALNEQFGQSAELNSIEIEEK